MQLANQPQRTISYKTSPVVQIGLAVIVFSIMLDLFDLWGRFFNRELLSHAACTVLPLTTPIWPITYDQTISSAHALCTKGVIAAPAASIIFLMLKMSIAIVAIIPYWIWTCLSNEEFLIAKERLFAKFDKPNGLREQIQFNTGAMLANVIFCWALYRQILVGGNSTMLTSIQKPIEDIMTAGTYLFSVITTLFSVVVTEYLLQTHRRT